MSEPVNTLVSDLEHTRKLAKINKLAAVQEQSHLGGFPCPCTSGKPHTKIEYRDLPTSEGEKISAIWLRTYPDRHSVAEHDRRSRIAILGSFPNYEPPDNWHRDFVPFTVTLNDQEV